MRLRRFYMFKKQWIGIICWFVILLVITCFLPVVASASGPTFSLSPSSTTMNNPITVTVTGSGFSANCTGYIWFDTYNNSQRDAGEPQVEVTTDNSTGAIPFGTTLNLPSLPPDKTYFVRASIGGTTISRVFSTSSTTTALTITKYDAHGNVLNSRSVSLQDMKSMKVYGNGSDHYCFEGPYTTATTKNDLWDTTETGNNISSRDYGAAEGTDAADLCDLAGGAAPGDTIKFIGSDGFSKTFDYESVYNERLANPLPDLGRMVVTWYTQGAQDTNNGYVPTYNTGMRLLFFPDTENDSLGEYVYGLWDMHQTLPQSRWYFYNNQYPSSSGLSVMYVYNIEIHQPNLIPCDVSGNAKNSFAPGETVYIKGLGLAANAGYKLWIQPEPVTLTVLDSSDIPTSGSYTLKTANDPSGSQETVNTNSSGDFSPIAIWNVSSSAATPAKYDIVADSQATGTPGVFDTADYIANPGYQGFTVNPQVATRLAFTTQPAGGTAGSVLATQPVVTVQDVDGNAVTGSNAAVTVGITSGSGASGVNLSGTKTVNAVNGVATFTDLNIDLSGSNYSLTVTSPGLSSALSSAFNVAVVTVISSGGGGSSGGSSSSSSQPINGMAQANWTPSVDGVTVININVTSQDGVGAINIHQGTLALDSQKKPLSSLTCAPVTTPAAHLPT